MDKQKRIALWLELHGPGLKARGVKWAYYCDTDRYVFYREVLVTSDAIAASTAEFSSTILEMLSGELYG